LAAAGAGTAAISSNDDVFRSRRSSLDLNLRWPTISGVRKGRLILICVMASTFGHDLEITVQNAMVLRRADVNTIVHVPSSRGIEAA
jgi:hypothetical protein